MQTVKCAYVEPDTVREENCPSCILKGSTNGRLLNRRIKDLKTEIKKSKKAKTTTRKGQKVPVKV